MLAGFGASSRFVTTWPLLRPMASPDATIFGSVLGSLREGRAGAAGAAFCVAALTLFARVERGGGQSREGAGTAPHTQAPPAPRRHATTTRQEDGSCLGGGHFRCAWHSLTAVRPPTHTLCWGQGARRRRRRQRGNGAAQMAGHEEAPDYFATTFSIEDEDHTLANSLRFFLNKK